MDKEFDLTVCTALNIDESECLNYLVNLTEMFSQNNWIYSHRNIDLFLFDVLEKIPNEWFESLSQLPVEKLWELPFGYTKNEWPSSLKTFVTQCCKLSEFRFPSGKLQDFVKEKKLQLLKKTSDKKQSEVKIMSHLIHKICQIVNCNLVIDIGSGLGYLIQSLHENFRICSIGLDCVQKYTVTAQKRLKNNRDCNYSVLHQTLEVNNSEESVLALKAILEKGSKLVCKCTPNEQVYTEQQSSAVMVGLHSCGNLAQDMMKLFCKLEKCVAFICVGCCYNKISLKDFPMSTIAKVAVETARINNPSWFPCISGLRLAAHGTKSNTASFPITLEAEKNLFYRAIFEYFIRKENITWSQPKRHVRSSCLTDFLTYCSKMLEGHILSEDAEVLRKLDDLYKEKENLFERVRCLLVLQTLLQPLWESFVILDRVLYFKEKSIDVEVIAMWDDSISSRNLALCAYKRF